MLALTLVAFAVAAGDPGQVHEDGYRSVALGAPLPFAVYLPPGYATSRPRYPVIYFAHGLPASPYAYRGIGFISSALGKLRQRAIVVAPGGRATATATPSTSTGDQGATG